MPCPLSLSPPTASSSSQTTCSVFFFAYRTNVRGGFIPSLKTNRRNALPFAQLHPRDTPLRAAPAARNCTSHRQPPTSALSCRCTAPLAVKTGSNLPPLAQPHPRNTLCARARRSTRPTRAAVRARYRLRSIHPRKTPLRDAPATRNCTWYRWPPAGAVAFDSATTLGGIYPLRKTIRPRFSSTCAASSAQHALRAQAAVQPNRPELHFSSSPICADSPALHAVALRTRQPTELTARPA